jgi:hypothetical protein
MKGDKMTAPRSNNQRGIVALITVILASILFTLVVVAMVSIIGAQEHQASEADLSNRAYFASESGVEAGLLKVKTALNSCSLAQINASTCPQLPEGACISEPPPIGASASDYTCLYLSHVNNVLTHYLDKDGAPYQIDLSSIPNVKKIIISWHQPSPGSQDSSNYQLIPFGTAPGNMFPANGAWPYPALIEMQEILFDGGLAPTTPFNPSSTQELKILESAIAPTEGYAGTDFEVDHYGTTTPATTNAISPLDAKCVPAGTVSNSGYACTEIITIQPPRNYLRILRLRARYTGANVSVEVVTTTSGNSSVPIPDSFEHIDVTAKSGDTTRRVTSEVALTQSTVSLDYALFSDTDICHDFLLRDSRSGNAVFGGVNSANAGSCPF